MLSRYFLIIESQRLKQYRQKEMEHKNSFTENKHDTEMETRTRSRTVMNTKTGSINLSDTKNDKSKKGGEMEEINQSPLTTDSLQGK